MAHLQRGVLFVFVLTALGGCAATDVTDESATTDLQYQLDLARASEDSGDFTSAMRLYTIAAAAAGPDSLTAGAARRAALLSLDPRNPARDDSTALGWLYHYLAYRITPGQREEANLMISLLEQKMAYARLLMLRTSMVDSLQRILELRDEELSTLSAQPLPAPPAEGRDRQSLEQELAAARRELSVLRAEVEILRKLQDVDVRMSQSRRRR
jgi:hypothetical protein